MIYAIAPLALILLWTCFLSYTALKAQWKYLRPEVKVAGGAVVLFGFLLDVAINWTLGLVLGKTKDLTLSQKCKRIGHGTGWQSDVAHYLCQNWLNVFDIDHC